MASATQSDLGKLQVNDTDYEGRIVIEQCAYWGSQGLSWAVPAFEESGCPDLVGDVPERIEVNGKPFVIGHSWSSRAAAETALRDFHA